MEVLDQRRLSVALTAEEARRGLRRWPINGDAGPAGLVERIGWGPGVVLGGMRYRLPLQVVDRDGAVLARVRRSRHSLGHATTHTIHRADHAVLGAVHTTAEGLALVDATGHMVASTWPQAGGPPGAFGLDSPYAGFEHARLTVSPDKGSWETQQVWALTGFDGLTDPLRLLTVCLTLVVAPWQAAERVGSGPDWVVQIEG